MRVLVTGGAGFIGSHLAQALCERGAQVLVLDDLSEGRLENLAWRQPAHALEFVQGSVCDTALVTKLVAGCDWVFHFAAITSVPQTVKDPLGSNAVNLDSTLRLLIAARDAGVKRFVFASSAAVYGNDPELPKREEMPADPVSPYGVQKFSSEEYCRLFHMHYGLEAVALRFFNVFGPRQSARSPYSGVIAKFCQAFLEGRPPTVFGDGRQTRDFVYVEDVVRANLLAAEAPAEKVAGKVFNVARGHSITLLDLIAALRRLSGRDLAPRFEPPREGDVRHSAADITAIRQTLGYEPAVDWEEGLRRTWAFYRERSAAGDPPDAASLDD